MIFKWLASLRNPKAPTREEIDAGMTVEPFQMDDIGELPSGWCDGVCQCGEPCTELAGHRPCLYFAGVSSPCRCLLH